MKAILVHEDFPLSVIAQAVEAAGWQLCETPAGNYWLVPAPGLLARLVRALRPSAQIIPFPYRASKREEQ